METIADFGEGLGGRRNKGEELLCRCPKTAAGSEQIQGICMLVHYFEPIGRQSPALIDHKMKIF
jgi:hypothetical protein